MDFERVLKAVPQELDQRRIRYAALGGVALGVFLSPCSSVLNATRFFRGHRP